MYSLSLFTTHSFYSAYDLIIKEAISSNVKLHTNSKIKSICVKDNGNGGDGKYLTITKISNEEDNKSHLTDCVILATGNSQLGLSLLKSPQISQL